MQKEKLIIIFTVFVDVVGFGIVIPILPFYVSSFSVSPFVITLLFSAFSLFAFISSPFLGALSDRIGRRPVLLTSIASTAAGWIVFAAANSVPMLFLGRIIDGAAAGNFSIAQSYLVDIARNERERTTNLGIMGAAFGIGLMVGPLIGAFLSNVSHAFPFWFAGGLASLNASAAYFFLPESHKERNPGRSMRINPLNPLLHALGDKELIPLYAPWLFFALAFFTSQSVFALYAAHAFGFDAFATGLLFTGMGVVMALNQAVLLNSVWLNFFREGSLARGMTIALFIGLVLMATESFPLFLVGLLLMATGQSILRVVITSQAAGRAGAAMKGEVIGILASLMAGGMVLAPVMAGALFEVNERLPYIVASIYMLAALVLIHKHVKTENTGLMQ